MQPKYARGTHHPVDREPVYRAEDAVAAALYVYTISMNVE